MSKVRLLAMMLIAISALSGCNAQQKASGILTYPQHWPLRQLTVPTGAQPAELLQHPGLQYIDGDEFSSGSKTSFLFAVAFDSADSWTSIRSHILTCLSADNYSVEEEIQGRHLVLIRSDNKYTVELLRDKLPNNNNYELYIWSEDRGSRNQ